MTRIFTKRIIGLMAQERILRVSFMLSLIFIILITVLVFVNLSFNQKIRANETQIQDVQTQISQLQAIVNESEASESALDAQERAFAPYTDIVPFINLLESLFAIIDKESKINVRDSENQILINRYADYEVSLKPDTKMELLLKALDQLHKSRYITKIIGFTVNYAPVKDENFNKIDEVHLTIRLYFE